MARMATRSILGISAYYHDSAACLVVDGEIVAAAQEERFTRRKQDDRFPELAIAYCLKQAGLAPADLPSAAAVTLFDSQRAPASPHFGRRLASAPAL
jgi:predicted NodU family carbamoyl transferase